MNDETVQCVRINFFNIQEFNAVSDRIIARIRKRFHQRIMEEPRVLCQKCFKAMVQILYVPEADSVFCMRCFERWPHKSRFPYLSMDLAIRLEGRGGWFLYEELEFYGLVHEYGLEDTQLLARSMTTATPPKTSEDVERYLLKVQLFREPEWPVQPYEEKRAGQGKGKGERELCQEFEEALDQYDTDLLDYFVAELHEWSDELQTRQILEQFYFHNCDRERSRRLIQSIALRYPQRNANLSLISSSSSLSDLEIKHGSLELERIQQSTHSLFDEADQFIAKLGLVPRSLDFQADVSGHAEEEEEPLKKDKGLAKTKKISRPTMQREAPSAPDIASKLPRKGILVNREGRREREQGHVKFNL